MTEAHALALLTASGFLCDPDEDDPDAAHTLRMNDVWAWGTADAEYIPDDALPHVADLFLWYGWCGILYWVSEQRGQMRSECDNVNRCIDFVRTEEQLKRERHSED